jgi:hypothetical protein
MCGEIERLLRTDPDGLGRFVTDWPKGATVDVLDVPVQNVMAQRSSVACLVDKRRVFLFGVRQYYERDLLRARREVKGPADQLNAEYGLPVECFLVRRTPSGDDFVPVYSTGRQRY